jgi:hypothetical protein
MDCWLVKKSGLLLLWLMTGLQPPSQHGGCFGHSSIWRPTPKGSIRAKQMHSQLKTAAPKCFHGIPPPVGCIATTAEMYRALCRRGAPHSGHPGAAVRGAPLCRGLRRRQGGGRPRLGLSAAPGPAGRGQDHPAPRRLQPAGQHIQVCCLVTASNRSTCSNAPRWLQAVCAGIRCTYGRCPAWQVKLK